MCSHQNYIYIIQLAAITTLKKYYDMDASINHLLFWTYIIFGDNQHKLHRDTNKWENLENYGNTSTFWLCYVFANVHT